MLKQRYLRTFCMDCTRNVFGGVCPNCGGEFSPRAGWPASRLLKNPALPRHVLRNHCVAPIGRLSRIR